MIEEFKSNIHLTKKDKETNTEAYLIYLRNRYESKAFQFSVILAGFSVFCYNRRSKLKGFPKFMYCANVFVAVYIFSYELISRMYTNKEKVFEIDDILLNRNV
jgi:hypothetical protein